VSLPVILRSAARAELAAFRAWYAAFDAGVWDKQFDDDVAAGRLDRLADETSRHLRQGRTIEL
jgi:hypothetical protein